MTKEEKEILLKDLCARLPYKVKIQSWYGAILTSDLNTFPFSMEEMDKEDMWDQLSGFKPYLRPLSSMTEEEKAELSDYVCERVMPGKGGIEFPPYPTDGIRVPFEWMQYWLDWLNAHHFDYRGLIPMGLALEAPENMYK